jgi:hypothetical protein
MGGPVPQGVLSRRKAVRIWVAGIALLVPAVFGGILAGGRWCTIVPVVFFTGHLLVATILARIRLSGRFLVEGTWLDVLTVLWVPWAGPIGWYLEWKRLRKNLSQR